MCNCDWANTELAVQARRYNTCVIGRFAFSMYLVGMTIRSIWVMWTNRRRFLKYRHHLHASDHVRD